MKAKSACKSKNIHCSRGGKFVQTITIVYDCFFFSFGGESEGKNVTMGGEANRDAVYRI